MEKLAFDLKTLIREVTFRIQKPAKDFYLTEFRRLWCKLIRVVLVKLSEVKPVGISSVRYVRQVSVELL